MLQLGATCGVVPSRITITVGLALADGSDHDVSEVSSTLPTWFSAQPRVKATAPRAGVRTAQRAGVGAPTARSTRTRPTAAGRPTADGRPTVASRATAARPAVGARVGPELAGRSLTPQRSGERSNRTPRRQRSRPGSIRTGVTSSSATPGTTGKAAPPSSTAS
jgi:hypothetical protein